MKQDLAVVFLLDALEHARTSTLVYRAAADCAAEREDRRRLAQFAGMVERDAETLARVCAGLGVSRDHPTVAREIAKDANEALRKQVASALAEADRPTAEALAWQCLVLTETKSLANLEMLAQIGPRLPATAAEAWSGAAAALLESSRGRLADARSTWEELLARRLELSDGGTTAEDTEMRANAAGA